MSVGLSLASPAVSQAWVNPPGGQPQLRNYANPTPGSYYNYSGYGYFPGNYRYGFNAYGYNPYLYNGYYGWNGYSYPGYYLGYTVYPNLGIVQPQFDFTVPYGY